MVMRVINAIKIKHYLDNTFKDSSTPTYRCIRIQSFYSFAIDNIPNNEILSYLLNVLKNYKNDPIFIEGILVNKGNMSYDKIDLIKGKKM